MNYPNIYALFSERVKQYAKRDVFFVRRDNEWHGIKWQAFGDQAHDFGCALIASGLTQGAAVCILMGNVPEWPVSDVGTIIAGGVGVGLYPTSSAEQCRYIINHSDAEFVLVDTPAQLEKILRVRDRLPKVKAVLALDETLAGDGVMSYRSFLELGRRHRDEVWPALEERARNARPADVAIMVYTSGTTGQPKGACLSHAYVINSVESLLATIPLDSRDVAFSYLPYCHVAERISGLYNRLAAGMAAYFVDDPAKLWTYLLDVKPTIFPSLPRFFEKVHAQVFADLQNAPDDERQRFQQALQVGRRLSRLRQANERVPDELQREYEQQALPALNRVKDYFGGRLRIATSGGAPLPVEIAEFFDACGLPILQAYGLTENVCVAFNRPDHHRFGTVGPPMPGCHVKVAADGEILVRSEMMFNGYYKEPQKTAEMFRDGWLATGDLGEMDADGFLKITGRKKELIITSTGKNVAPLLLENLLKAHPLISQAMAYGDGKSYLVALITLNQAETVSYARARGIAHDSFAALTRAEEIIALVRRIVEEVNAQLSSTEAIKKFVLLDHDLSIEADEITPTMKIKRNIVSARYKDLLEAFYQ
jgi:long-chain acyl-CoA synthetase